MEEIRQEEPSLRHDALTSLSDDRLREIIARAHEVLIERENERKRKTVAEIRRLAKECGLEVIVKEPSRRRGRPRKDGPADAG